MKSFSFASIAVIALGAVTSIAACSSSTTSGSPTEDAGVETAVEGGTTCPAGFETCGNECVSTQKDPEHCGACNTKCAAGQVCSAGACATVCGAGQAECGGTCVTTATDNANCGACGNTCATGEVCSMGKCAVSCASPLTTCSGAAGDAGAGSFCANTKTDRLHCGACNLACAAGEICVDGDCKVSCPTGTTECSGSCKDVQNDRANCGACGTACATGESCVAGTCTLVCSGGSTKCGTACVDTNTNRANCGACGNVCGTGEACSGGTCSLFCGSGTTKCGTSCTVTATDPANCGACGTVCPARANAAAACVSSACRLACNPGFADCNAIATDGCEVNVLTSTANCGACGKTCAAGQICTAGACASAATTVLLFADSGTLAGEAATALGHTVITATSTDFNTKFDAGGFTLVIIDSAANGLPSGADTRLASWATAGNRLIFAYWDLDAAPALQTALGVTTSTFTAVRPIHAATTAPVNFFTTPRAFPSPLTGTDSFSDDGDVLTLTGSGFIAAHFDSPTGGGAIAVTRANRVVVNGFLPPEFAVADGDADGIKDMRELYENQIVWVTTH